MSDTQQIKDNLDIVDFINEYVQLKPAGSNHKGLCPFHNEKSPSFMASRERQSWRCFGCSKGGDIFSFVQEIEGLEFVEALKLLAEKAGVTLSNNFAGNSKAGEKKVRLKAIMAEAIRFYHQFYLKMDTAAEARSYLQDRGLQEHTIDVWKIGFVPDQWDLLTKYLLKKGFSIDDMVDAGLTIKREGADKTSGRGYYDRFRGRVMFPINDVQGNPVGVTGRVLIETEKSGGKYVNTPQTDIYDKSNILFGLDTAKGAIRTADEVVVVEGQMDVIAVWQSGMENVVASSGTALSEQQIKLMGRYSKNIVMAFDTDEAGLKAAKRGIALALEAGMRVRVIHIPDSVAKDPDECVKKDPELWKQYVAGAKEVIAWYIDLATERHDLHSPRGKQSAADEVLPEIVRIPYAVERDHWIQTLSAAIGVDSTVLKEDMIRHVGNKKKTPNTSTVSEVIPIPAFTEEEESYIDTKLDHMLREYMAILLSFPQENNHTLVAVPDGIPLNKDLRALYETIKVVYTPEEPINLVQIESEENKLLIDTLLLQASLHVQDFTEKDRKEEIKALTQHIHEYIEKNRRELLIQELAQAEASKNSERVQEILQLLQ